MNGSCWTMRKRRRDTGTCLIFFGRYTLDPSTHDFVVAVLRILQHLPLDLLTDVEHIQLPDNSAPTAVSKGGQSEFVHVLLQKCPRLKVIVMPWITKAHRGRALWQRENYNRVPWLMLDECIGAVKSGRIAETRYHGHSEFVTSMDKLVVRRMLNQQEHNVLAQTLAGFDRPYPPTVMQGVQSIDTLYEHEELHAKLRRAVRDAMIRRTGATVEVVACLPVPGLEGHFYKPMVKISRFTSVDLDQRIDEAFKYWQDACPMCLYQEDCPHSPENILPSSTSLLVQQVLMGDLRPRRGCPRCAYPVCYKVEDSIGDDNAGTLATISERSSHECAQAGRIFEIVLTLYEGRCPLFQSHLKALLRMEGKEANDESVIDYLTSESLLSDTIANVVEIFLIWTQALRDTRT